MNRASDQWFTIDQLAAGGGFLDGVLDVSRVAVIGYSMGGYGALASAGAGYSRQGGAMRTVPGGYLEPWTAGSPAFPARRRDNLKAMVAIAPWGAQPPQNNWDAEGFAGIRVPSLFIAGDQDDVSGFEQGTRKVFENAVNAERYLLVYQYARHNVGGNPPPPEAMDNFAARAFFDEPVWRKDRIAAINQHFITAFLDASLRQDAGHRAFLEVPTVESDAGSWPIAFGAQTGARRSGAGEPGYWRGFARGTAAGMALEHKEKGK